MNKICFSLRNSSYAIVDISGLLYAVGGYDGASRHCLSTVECHNPESDSWTPVADMSCRRSGAGKQHAWTEHG